MTPELCGQESTNCWYAGCSNLITSHRTGLRNLFGRKVEDIRTATAAAPSPDIQVRSTASLRYFSPVSCNEVTSILARTPSKSCLLDPMPTWLVKKLQEVLVPVICNLCNASLQHGVFLTSLKQATVLP